MAEESPAGGGGQDLPGDYYTHGTWHQGYYSIAVGEVSKLIGRASGLIDELEDARKAVTRSELPSSALGGCHEARHVAKTWNDAIGTRLHDLKRLIEKTESIPDRLTQSVGVYVQAEEQNVRNGNGVIDQNSTVKDARQGAEFQHKDDKVLQTYLSNPDNNNEWASLTNFHEMGDDPTHK